MECFYIFNNRSWLVLKMNLLVVKILFITCLLVRIYKNCIATIQCYCRCHTWCWCCCPQSPGLCLRRSWWWSVISRRPELESAVSLMHRPSHSVLRTRASKNIKQFLFYFVSKTIVILARVGDSRLMRTSGPSVMMKRWRVRPHPPSPPLTAGPVQMFSTVWGRTP